MVHRAADPGVMEKIVEVLCGVDRPESILTWKRSTKVQALLTGLASGEIPVSHDGLDAAVAADTSPTYGACSNTTTSYRSVTNTSPASSPGSLQNSVRSLSQP
jgi:hypothetical protein